MELIHGDCLEKLKKIPDNSIDLVFCDLPYGQTSCKWDCKIDLKNWYKKLKNGGIFAGHDFNINFVKQTV